MTFIDQVKQSGKPFVYLHTHIVDEPLLNAAIAAGGSIEIDISVDDHGRIFVGHPLSFYEFKQLASPNNLDSNHIIEKLEKTNLIVVIDCKDIRAIDWVYQAIARLGADRVIVHGFVDSLLFKPYRTDYIIEPHWIHEDLPLSALKKLRDDTGVSLLLSSRGLSSNYIQANFTAVIRTIQNTVDQTQAVISLNLPVGDTPSQNILTSLANQNVLVLRNIDTTPDDELPAMYIGVTDDLNRQTVNFNK